MESVFGKEERLRITADFPTGRHERAYRESHLAQDRLQDPEPLQRGPALQPLAGRCVSSICFARLDRAAERRRASASALLGAGKINELSCARAGLRHAFRPGASLTRGRPPRPCEPGQEGEPGGQCRDCATITGGAARDLCTVASRASSISAIVTLDGHRPGLAQLACLQSA